VLLVEEEGVARAHRGFGGQRLAARAPALERFAALGVDQVAQRANEAPDVVFRVRVGDERHDPPVVLELGRDATVVEQPILGLIARQPHGRSLDERVRRVDR
jgi:hypothetical protein